MFCHETVSLLSRSLTFSHLLTTTTPRLNPRRLRAMECKVSAFNRVKIIKFNSVIKFRMSFQKLLSLDRIHHTFPFFAFTINAFTFSTR